MSDNLSFIHRFEPAVQPASHPIVLLHGTGGNEDDLLPLGRMIAPRSALLSPRGKVSENGMPRFFRRVALGVFDEDNVRQRANELADFIGEASNSYGIPTPIAVGYSNGANVAAAILLLRPTALTGALLLRATLPLAHPPRADLAGKPVLILSGAADPLIRADGAARLASTLEHCGANVSHRTLPVGHELSQADLTMARTWLEEHEAGAANERAR